MTTGFRRTVAVLFTLCAAICGFAAGAWLGARFLVPPGSGLAGPAIVLGYGVVGAVAALIVGIVAAWRLKGRAFHLAAWPVIALGIVLGGSVSYAVFKAGEERDAYLAGQRASLPVFELSLAVTGTGPATLPFTRFDYDGDTHEFGVRDTAGVACGGSLSPTSEEKLTLLVALRQVEELLAREDEPCGDAAQASLRLDFTIREHKPPDTTGAVAITEACLARHDALSGAVASIETVYGQLRPNCR